MRKVLVVGATSAIAEATARLFAADRDRLFLAARDPKRLAAVAADLRVRGAERVGHALYDALDRDRPPTLIEEAVATLGGLDTVLIAHGSNPDQQLCEQSFDAARRELEVNALSVLALLTLLANRFEAQGRGTLCVIGSVAGDRGRQSNYVYGTAKAAVATFMQGLRNRLHRSGVRVITIKPGFVDTPLTAGREKGPLWATPQQVARGIHRAIARGGDVVYLPAFWRPIIVIIRLLPERVFKRLSL